MSSPLLTFLRSATEPAHRRLEQLVSLDQMCASVDCYARILQGFGAIWPDLEDAAHRSAVEQQIAPPHMGERRRAHLITADLAALGYPSSTERRRDVRRELLRIQSPQAATLAGLLYVLEGSTLGGQVICKHLSERLGLKPGRGSSFFFGNGARTAQLWRAFCQWASDVVPQAQFAACAASAQDAFGLVEAHLASPQLQPGEVLAEAVPGQARPATG